MPVVFVVVVVLVLLGLGGGVAFAKSAAGGDVTVMPGVPFDSFFSHYSRLHSVPKRLMVAIVAHESGFNANAVNEETSADVRKGRDVASLGLCQILFPDTARSLYPGISRDDCFDVETNLDMGFRVMKEQLARYPSQGFPDDAVSAYNAGHSLRHQDGSFGNQSYVNAVRAQWERFANA